jgi:hypothetical protein
MQLGNLGVTVVTLNNLCLLTWVWMVCMGIAMISLYNLRLFAYIWMSCMVTAQRQAVTWLWRKLRIEIVLRGELFSVATGLLQDYWWKRRMGGKCLRGGLYYLGRLVHNRIAGEKLQWKVFRHQYGYQDMRGFKRWPGRISQLITCLRMENYEVWIEKDNYGLWTCFELELRKQKQWSTRQVGRILADHVI